MGFYFFFPYHLAVYAAKIKAFTDGQKVDTDKHKGEEGMTLELCAGIMDKDKDVTEMAQAEVLEETGYKVPLENLKKITSFRYVFNFLSLSLRWAMQCSF